MLENIFLDEGSPFHISASLISIFSVALRQLTEKASVIAVTPLFDIVSDNFNWFGGIFSLLNVSQNVVDSFPMGLKGGTCFLNNSFGGIVLSSGVEILKIPLKKLRSSAENLLDKDIASINIEDINKPDVKDETEFALAVDSM